MRPRPSGVGRRAHGARVEERRVGDDRVRLVVGEPGFAAGARVADIERKDLHALGETVPRCVAGGEPREAVVDLRPDRP